MLKILCYVFRSSFLLYHLMDSVHTCWGQRYLSKHFISSISSHDFVSVMGLKICLCATKSKHDFRWAILSGDRSYCITIWKKKTKAFQTGCLSNFTVAFCSCWQREVRSWLAWVTRLRTWPCRLRPSKMLHTNLCWNTRTRSGTNFNQTYQASYSNCWFIYRLLRFHRFWTEVASWTLDFDWWNQMVAAVVSQVGFGSHSIWIYSHCIGFTAAEWAFTRSRSLLFFFLDGLVNICLWQYQMLASGIVSAKYLRGYEIWFWRLIRERTWFVGGQEIPVVLLKFLHLVRYFVVVGYIYVCYP